MIGFVLPDNVIIFTLVCVALVAIVIVALVLRLLMTGGTYPPQALTPAQNAVFVTNADNNTITIYPIDLNAPDDNQVASVPSATWWGAELNGPLDIALDPSGRAFVVNLPATGAPSIATYNVDFGSLTFQLQGTIAGDLTLLEIPRGIAFLAPSGTLMIANQTQQELTRQPPSLLEFSVNGGNQAPIGRILGGGSGIFAPWQLTASDNGTLYVPEPFQDALLVFTTRSGTTSSAAPTWRIAGDTTGLSRPVSVAVDRDQATYVLNLNLESGSPSVTSYPPVATQPQGVLNIAPLWTLDGTGILAQPSGIAVDNRGRLYVTDVYPDAELSTGPVRATQGARLVVFQLNGANPPTWVQTVVGADSGLFGPHGLAVI